MQSRLDSLLHVHYYYTIFFPSDCERNEHKNSFVGFQKQLGPLALWALHLTYSWLCWELQGGGSLRNCKLAEVCKKQIVLTSVPYMILKSKQNLRGQCIRNRGEDFLAITQPVVVMVVVVCVHVCMCLCVCVAGEGDGKNLTLASPVMSVPKQKKNTWPASIINKCIF